jgi:pimeloyl-ACP methyl ester carboxylesterase
MGSFFFGGTVTTGQDGVTFHGDHGYAQYYLPQNSRNYPLVMWHGIGQSGRTYESTPDGREGFQAIFARRNWPVYIIDQPRRGRAGRTQAGPLQTIPPVLTAESFAWNAFRVGIWVPPTGAKFYPGIQFPQDGYSIDQFMRQQTPDTGDEPRTPEYRDFMGKTMAELFKVTGPGILITHSNSGQYGWTTAMAAPELVKAVVAYEPGAVVFPEGETPSEISSNHQRVAASAHPRTVPVEEFKKLTRVPILIIYGDYIPTEQFEVSDADFWRTASIRARQFVDVVNRHGGDAQLVFLPDIGIKGNSHFPFADLNNIEIADFLEKFLRDKKLDGRNTPHQGPQKPEMALAIPLAQ